MANLRVIDIKPIMRASVLSLLIFITLAGLWVSLTPLEGGVLARGHVRVSESNRQLQHRTGGQILKVSVSEGSVVEVGDALIELDVKADRSVLKAKLNEYLFLLATRETASASLDEDMNFQFSDKVVKLAQRLEKRMVISNILRAHRHQQQLREEQVKMFSSQHHQKNLRIESQASRVDALSQRLALAVEQIDRFEKMRLNKFVSEQDLRNLREQRIVLDSELVAANKKLSELQTSKSYTELERRHFVLSARADALARIESIDFQLPTLEDSINRATQIVSEAIVQARFSGTVTHLNFRSSGEVVLPGQDILQILPDDEALIVEARLKTQDVDSVFKGQQARVRLVAYDARNTPLLHGEVIKVSADRYEDELGDYFKLEIFVPTSEFGRYPEMKMTAGMPVDCILVTAKRTVADYLLSPVYRSIEQSFRET